MTNTKDLENLKPLFWMALSLGLVALKRMVFKTAKKKSYPDIFFKLF